MNLGWPCSTSTTEGRNGGANVYFQWGMVIAQGMVTRIRMVIIIAMAAVLGMATFLKKGYPPWYSYNA